MVRSGGGVCLLAKIFERATPDLLGVCEIWARDALLCDLYPAGGNPAAQPPINAIHCTTPFKLYTRHGPHAGHRGACGAAQAGDAARDAAPSPHHSRARRRRTRPLGVFVSQTFPDDARKQLPRRGLVYEMPHTRARTTILAAAPAAPPMLPPPPSEPSFAAGGRTPLWRRPE